MIDGNGCRCNEGGGFRVPVELIGRWENNIEKTFIWLWVPRTAGLLTNWLAERLYTTLGILPAGLWIEVVAQHPGPPQKRLLFPSDPLTVVQPNDIIIVSHIDITKLSNYRKGFIFLPPEPSNQNRISKPTPMQLDKHSVCDKQTNTDNEHHKNDKSSEDSQYVNILEMGQNQVVEECEQDQPSEGYQHPGTCEDKLMRQKDNKMSKNPEICGNKLNETFENNNVTGDTENITNILLKQNEKEKIVFQNNSYAKTFNAVHKFFDKPEVIPDNGQDQHDSGNNVTETQRPAQTNETALVQTTENCNESEMQVESASEEPISQSMEDNEDDELSRKREAALRLLDQKLSALSGLQNSVKGELMERRRRRRVRRRRKPAPYSLETQSDNTPKNSKVRTQEWVSRVQESLASNSVQDGSDSKYARDNSIRKDQDEGKKTLEPLGGDTCDGIASPVVTEVQDNIKSTKGQSDLSFNSVVQNTRGGNLNDHTAVVSETWSTPASPPVSVVRASPNVPLKGRIVRAIL